MHEMLKEQTKDQLKMDQVQAKQFIKRMRQEQ